MTQITKSLAKQLKMKLEILFFLFSCAAAFSPGWRARLRSPPTPPNVKLPEPQWIDQYLDHTNMSDKTTWKQRYFVNDTFWSKQDGPVFLLLGGEGPADPTWLAVDTEIMINAQKFNALVFSIEHRFYGDSHPTPDASVDSLKYLSSRQALADASYFYHLMAEKYGMTAKNRWISFGGSYSGALSAWLRLLYPTKIAAAVATSAPVEAIVDFSQYLEVVSASLGTSTHGADCVNAVKEATTQLDMWLSNQNTWKMAEETFSISPPLESEMDVALAAQNLAGNFMGVVQYNKDNSAFEGRSNSITIEDLCTMMLNETLGPPVVRYSAVNRRMTDNSPLDCNYKSYISEMKNDSWLGDVSKEGARQWYYQTCTEFGYFQTTNSASQPFGNLISLDSYTDVCKEVYGIDEDTIKKAIADTNSYYKGKQILTSKVVFPNGSIDPWHQLSILSDLSSTVTAIFIHGTAHCANMYPPSPKDLPELTQARVKITAAIQSWLE